MTTVEALEAALSAKKQALELCEDEGQRQKLSDEILAINRDIGRAEAEAEHANHDTTPEDEAETRAAARARSRMAANIPGTEERLQVGPPAVYRAANGMPFRLKAEMQAFLDPYGAARRMPAAVRQQLGADPDRLERWTKGWCDMIARAWSQSPGELDARLKASMQEDTDSEGGYLLIEEFRPELLAYAREMSVMLRLGTVVPMTARAMEIPRELTQVTVEIAAEEAQVSEAAATLDQVLLTAKQVRAYAQSSRELVDDAMVRGGIAGLLSSQFMEAVGLKIDSAAFKAGGDPVSGIFIGGAGVSQTFESGSTAFSELLESDLRFLVSKIPAHRRQSGTAWIANGDVVWQLIYGLKDTNGRNLFIPNNVVSAPGMLMGAPLEESTQAPAADDTGADTGFIAFGDFSGFYIGERLADMTLVADPYTRMEYGQIRFHLFNRWAWAHGLPDNYGRIVTAA